MADEPEQLTREQAEELIRAASWKRRVPCPHCNGEGDMPGDEDAVHTFRVGGPVLMGADTALASVLEDLALADPEAISVGMSPVGRVVQFYVQPGDQHRAVNVR